MELKQHFVKNNDFKTVQASGVYGGLTHSGLVNMVVITDRIPLPNSITLEIDDETGNVAREINRDAKDGIMREFQIGILMDLETTKETIKWLSSQVESLESLISKRQNK